MSKDDKSATDRGIKMDQAAAGNGAVSAGGNAAKTAGDNELPGERQHVPKVFISSTSEDLKAYRDAAIGARMLPVQMEYFAASGQHPPLQTCLHKVAEVDLVVLIVAYRYGWVPDDQEAGQYKSITWLECEQARADKKAVLAFLIDEGQAWDEKLKEQYLIAAAVSEGKATPELLAEVQRNVKRLADFKQWIDSIGVRVIFTTPEDLRGRVSDALREWKQHHDKPDTKPPGEIRVKSSRPNFPAAYREWLQRQCADIELLGVRLKQGQAIKLNHVYVPLITTVPEKVFRRKGRGRKLSEADELLHAELREKPRLLLAQLDKQSLYVPGDPGTGKSTFCRWVAWLAAAGSLPEAEIAADEAYVESFPLTLTNRLPLLIRLRDVWKYLPKDAGRDSLSKTELESALGNWLDTGSPGGLDWADVTPHLEHGTALLIFDGVDEVPLREGDGRGACYPRAMLLAGLTDAAAAFTPLPFAAEGGVRKIFHSASCCRGIQARRASEWVHGGRNSLAGASRLHWQGCPRE